MISMKAKRVFSVILLDVLLAFFSTLSFDVRPVSAYATICIRADGTVDPSDAPISSLDNMTYTLTNTINASIVVERDNIVLDGGGYTLQGAASGVGIDLSNRNNVTIRNITVKLFTYGISLYDACKNTIFDSNIVEGCDIYGFGGFGVKLEESSHNTIFQNNITGNGFGIVLDSSNNNIIHRNNITANIYHAIFFHYSDFNCISENEISGNNRAIYFDFSSNNTIRYNNIFRTRYKAIRLGYCFNNTILGNNITQNEWWGGLWLYQSSYNSILVNNISENKYVAFLLDSHSNYNLISENNMISNVDLGVSINSSIGNRFYHNNFMFNPRQVSILAANCSNFWDDNLEGNCWSSYNEPDLDDDGIGEAPYEINPDNIDHHPLMGMFHSFNTSFRCCVNVISNSTIEEFTYYESNSTIKMRVFGENSPGFCRVCVPYVLMNVSDIYVIIDNGNSAVLYSNYHLYDNGTHRWIYFVYEHSSHEIVIVPEFSPISLLSAFTMITLLAGMARKKMERSTLKRV